MARPRVCVRASSSDELGLLDLCSYARRHHRVVLLMGFRERCDPYSRGVGVADVRRNKQHKQPRIASCVRPGSPDGQWLAFSSDRNTDWRGHYGGKGWEHTQELHLCHPRRRPELPAESPPGPAIASALQMVADGRSVAFYEMTTEDTWGARRPNLVANVTSQIVSADVTSESASSTHPARG